MEIETRHLRLVKAVADEGSITRAASVLGTTQPALTRQLRRVEENLGGPLFQRSRSGVEQTPLGRLVVGRANAVLSVIDSLQTDMATGASLLPPTQVRVGVKFGNALVGLMRGLRSVLPNTEIVTDSETRIDGLLDLVTSSRIDFAVIHEFVGHEIPLGGRLLAQPVGCEPAFVLMAAFLIGEEININGDGTPLRYMDKPSKDGGSYDCWNSSVPNSDPHYSSGVGNHFFYLLSNGSGAGTYGNSPTCNGSTIAGIGRDKAAAIWYRALSQYMTSDETYRWARLDTISSATDLYGTTSPEVAAVKAAWTAVSVS